MATLNSLVSEAIARYGDSEAVIYDDGQGRKSNTLTYTELGERSQQICNLLQKAGLHKDVVGVGLNSNVLVPSVIMGIMETPAAFLPIDIHGPEATMCSTLKRLNVRVVITGTAHVQRLQQMTGGQSGRVDQIADTDLSLVWLGSARVQLDWDTSPLAYVITTSGSTGQPKIVRVPHKCIVPNVTHIRSIYKMSPADVSILMSPLTFDPSIVEIFVALTSGAKLILVPDVYKLVPELLMDVVSRHNVTVMQATPSVMRSQGLSTGLLRASGGLRVLSLGGEACPNTTTLRSWCEEGNTTMFVNLYGITEVSSWALYHVLSEEDLRTDREVPLGRPLKDTYYAVRNENCEMVSVGEGYLHVGSSSRLCHIDDEEHSPSAGMRPTGDRVLIEASGRILYRGRTDHQMKRNGKRLNLERLEQVVTELDVIDHCAAYIKDEVYLHVVVQLRYDQQSTNHIGPVANEVETLVMNHLHERLPSQYSPDKIWALDSLPYTSHGKVDRPRIQELVANVGEDTIPSQTSQKRTEQLFNDIWNVSLFLGSDHTPAGNDNFIQAGGDSFSAVRLLNLLSRHTGVNYTQLADVVLRGTYEEVLSTLTGTTASRGRSLHRPNSPSDTSRGSDKSSDEETQSGATVLFSSSKSNQRSSKTSQSRKRTLADNEMSEEAQPTKKALYPAPKVDDDREDCIVGVGRRTTHLCCENKSLCNIYQENGAKTVQNIKVTHAQIHLRPTWEHDTGKCIDATPLLVKQKSGDTIFIGSHSHKFLAIDAGTGHLKWERVLCDRVESSACLSPCGKAVVVGCYDGYVYVLDIHTGDTIWQFQTTDTVKCSPYADTKSGLVFVGSHDQFIYALNIKEKTCEWRRHLAAGSVYSSPVCCTVSDSVYVATLGGAIVCLNSLTGEETWRQQQGKPVFSSLCALPGGGAVVGCVDGRLYAFNKDGEKLWTFRTQAAIFSSPCFWSRRHSNIRASNPDVASERFVFGCDDKYVYCVDGKGAEMWKFRMESNVFASPFILSIKLPNANVLSPTSQTNQGASSKPDCDISVTMPSKGLSKDSCYYHPVVLVSSSKGWLFVLDLEGGALLGEYKFKGEVFSSVVADGEHVYVGCRDDNMYCLNITASVE